MNVKKLLVLTAAVVVSSAQAYSVSVVAEDSFKVITQTATKIATEEVPPVEDEDLEELLGQCPVYPACPPVF